MSCIACEAAQVRREGRYLGRQAPGPGGWPKAVYVRVGTANVELVGCAEHVADVIEAVRRWERLKAPPPTTLLWPPDQPN